MKNLNLKLFITFSPAQSPIFIKDENQKLKRAINLITSIYPSNLEHQFNYTKISETLYSLNT